MRERNNLRLGQQLMTMARSGMQKELKQAGIHIPPVLPPPLQSQNKTVPSMATTSFSPETVAQVGSIKSTVKTGKVNTGVDWLDNTLNEAIDNYNVGKEEKNKDWLEKNWGYLAAGADLLMLAKKK